MKKTNVITALTLSAVMLAGAMSVTAFAETGTSELNVMIETPVQTLDPQLIQDGTSIEVLGNFMEGLLQMDKDGNMIPDLAESYEVSDDGLVYTFHLRQDAVWSNGTPVTAADFVYGWQRAVDPDVASEYSYMLSDITHVKNAEQIIAGELDKSELGVAALDDYTFEVTLEVPVSYFVSLMFFPTFYPTNQAFFETCADTYGTSPDTILANGAFVLEDYQPAATSIHLVKNETYFGADDVSLPGLNYQVIQDTQQALMSYQVGDLDVTTLTGDQVDQVIDDPEYINISMAQLWYVSPNVDKVPELANKNIRMALTFAIDRETIANDVLKDGSRPTYTAIPMDFATGPDGTDFSADQERYAEVCGLDPEKAADYWAKGLEELGISELTLDMTVDADDAPQKVAQVLKEEWETTLPGLTVNLVVEPKKQRVEDMHKGDFQLGLTRWGPDYADPMTYLGMWVTGNTNNYGQWSNADYDAMIEECSTGDLSTDLEGRWAKLYEAEDMIMNDAVIIPVYTQCNAEMISSRVTGIEFHSVGLNRVYKNAVKAE